MNIEEERKAFEAWLKASFDYNEYDDKEYLFPVWLAAKEHAEEDIKKLLNICAFETIEQARAYYAEQKPVSVSVVTAQDTYDAGFAAGIAYAEEMAKPEARYATISGIVNLYFDVNLSKPGVCSIAYFESVAGAKVWASNNGYRVIE